MHIRIGEYKDIPQIVKLGKQLLELHGEFDKDYYLLEEDFENLFAGWLKEQMNLPSAFFLVAERTENEEERIVGFVSGFLKALFPWFRTKTVGHISYLAIDRNFRKQGIGKLLEEAAISWFRNKNVSYIEVYVDEKNQIGQKAWSTYGFLPFKKFLRKKI